MLGLDELCRAMVENNASDLHISAGVPPLLRIDGDLYPMELPSLNPAQTKELAYQILSEEQIKEFERDHELDMSFGIKGLSRFRVNVYLDRGSAAIALRTIPYEIFSFDELGLPRCIAEMSEKPYGLVLVCGPTGSGKSTTLATILDKINRTRRAHIITIEDPIEFLHSHQTSLVNQREVFSDTHSFSAALKRVLRQDPDVILIGEMRDLETIEAAISVAETGHLVFATLHANDATQAINRMIDVFPAHQQPQVRTQLSFVLEGVVIQRLLMRASGEGRALAMEIMLPDTAIRSLIREGKLQQIYSAIMTGGGVGMQTMNQSLAHLYRNNAITYDVAMHSSADAEDLQRIIEKGY